LTMLMVGRSVTYQGVVTAAGNLPAMAVGPDRLVPGDDMAGQIIVGGALGDLRVAGGTPGTIAAAAVGTVRTYGGFGPFVAQIMEAGVRRRVEADLPGNEYPIPPAVPVPTTRPSQYVNFQYVYEGTDTGLVSPQLTVRITNPVSTRPDQFDLNLVTLGDAKFNLARAVAAGVSGVRNVVVEGDLLTAITPVAQTFIGQVTAAGGVMLPLDNVAGVAVRDFAPVGSIQAKSIQAVSFGSTQRVPGVPLTGRQIATTDARNLLVPGTAIVPGGSTNGTGTEAYRVAFTRAAAQQVAFFLATGQTAAQFDSANVLFAAQELNGQRLNAARGAVTAIITAAVGTYPKGASASTILQTIALRGDGGSFASQLWVARAITSTGPLGDVAVSSPLGLTDLSAPSVFGSLSSNGPLAGTVQTTGLRTDPITGVTTSVPGDFGRAYVLTASNGTRSVTSTTVTVKKSNVSDQTSASALTGRLIVRGTLYSQVVATGGISGIVAVQGNLGGFSTLLSAASPARVGGIDVSSGLTGKVVVLGRVIGDLNLTGGMSDGGSVAAAGGILGNVTVKGIGAGSSIISGGGIGDATLGTGLSVSSNQGIVAAMNGIVNKGAVSKTAGYYSANAALVPDGIDAGVIRALFAGPTGAPLTTLDFAADDLGGLLSILGKLDRLRVVGGRLTLS
jgi:hypothetical protein